MRAKRGRDRLDTRRLAGVSGADANQVRDRRDTRRLAWGEGGDAKRGRDRLDTSRLAEVSRDCKKWGARRAREVGAEMKGDSRES